MSAPVLHHTEMHTYKRSGHILRDGDCAQFNYRLLQVQCIIYDTFVIMLKIEAVVKKRERDNGRGGQALASRHTIMVYARLFMTINIETSRFRFRRRDGTNHGAWCVVSQCCEPKTVTCFFADRNLHFSGRFFGGGNTSRNRKPACFFSVNLFLCPVRRYHPHVWNPPLHVWVSPAYSPQPTARSPHP